MEQSNHTLPDPLVSAEVDLRGLPYMPLYLERLRKSKAWIACKRRPALAFYMLNLWMRMWEEAPAASIEDDEDVIADAAGVDLNAWPEVREAVMRSMVKCSDGRLYHPVVAELALEAWEQRKSYRERLANARAAKEAKKKGRETPDAEGGGGSITGPDIEADTATVTGPVKGSITETVTETAIEPVVEAATGPATGQPQAFKVKQEGEHINKPPPKPDPFTRVHEGDPSKVVVAKRFLALHAELWPDTQHRPSGRMYLETEAQAYLDEGHPADLLWGLIEEGMRGWKDPVPPGSIGAFKRSLPNRLAQIQRAMAGPAASNDRQSRGIVVPATANPDDRWGHWKPYAQRLRSFAKTGRWDAIWGDPPGHRMCQIPLDMIREYAPAVLADQAGGSA